MPRAYNIGEHDKAVNAGGYITIPQEGYPGHPEWAPGTRQWVAPGSPSPEELYGQDFAQKWRGGVGAVGLPGAGGQPNTGMGGPGGGEGTGLGTGGSATGNVIPGDTRNTGNGSQTPGNRQQGGSSNPLTQPGFWANLLTSMGGTPGLINTGMQLAGAIYGANTANRAAEIEAKSAADQLEFARGIYGDQRRDQAPFLAAGTTAVNTLAADPTLTTPFDQTFQAPGYDDIFLNPAVQARIKAAQRTLENSASSRGNLMTTGFREDENRLTQDIASEEYDKIYGRARSEFQDAYNIFQGNQATRRNALQSLAGVGQTSAQSLSGAASNFGREGSEAMSAGANARAAGTIASGNAYSDAFSNIGDSVATLDMYRRLYGGRKAA